MNNTLPASTQPEPTDSAQLSRGEFLRSLGLSSAALMAFYCMGTLSSCSGGGDDPTPTTPATPSNGITGNALTASGPIDFTVDLTNSAVSGLKTAGNSAKIGDIFVANAKSGFVALTKYCTHQGVDGLSYRSTSDDIICSAHSSVFRPDGTVVNGPAATPLKRYTATLSANGNTLTVKG